MGCDDHLRTNIVDADSRSARRATILQSVSPRAKSQTFLTAPHAHEAISRHPGGPLLFLDTAHPSQYLDFRLSSFITKISHLFPIRLNHRAWRHYSRSHRDSGTAAREAANHSGKLGGSPRWKGCPSSSLTTRTQGTPR